MLAYTFFFYLWEKFICSGFHDFSILAQFLHLCLTDQVNFLLCVGVKQAPLRDLTQDIVGLSLGAALDLGQRLQLGGHD